jgi:hypothetical protein
MSSFAPRNLKAVSPFYSLFAQKTHVKPPKPQNLQIQLGKQHKKKELPYKNISTESGILVMPHSLK